MNFTDYKGNKYLKLSSVILSIIVMNVLFLGFCNIMKCYEVSFINVFRGNLICNMCIDISYHLYNYQIILYTSIGGMIIKTMDKHIKLVMESITLT